MAEAAESAQRAAHEASGALTEEVGEAILDLMEFGQLTWDEAAARHAKERGGPVHARPKGIGFEAIDRQILQARALQGFMQEEDRRRRAAASAPPPRPPAPERSPEPARAAERRPAPVPLALTVGMQVATTPPALALTAAMQVAAPRPAAEPPRAAAPPAPAPAPEPRPVTEDPEERLETAQLRVREALAARSEAVEPPTWEAFWMRCDEVGLGSNPRVRGTWTAEHEPWWAWLTERLEVERPEFEPPAEPMLETARRARTVQAAAASLFTTPAWRAHAERAVTMAATMPPAEPRPAFGRFRAAVERMQELRARLAARAEPSKPAPAPPPEAPRARPGPEEEVWRPRGP